MLELIIKFSTVAFQAIQAIEKISKAQAEGRDLTDEELAEMDTEREAAEADWKAALQKLRDEKNNTPE